MNTISRETILNFLLSISIGGALLWSPCIFALDSPSDKTVENIKQGLSERIKEVEAKALEARQPNESNADAYRRTTQDSARRLEDQFETMDADKKLRFAATMYLGFYYANIYRQPKYCEQIGVPLVKWIKEFENTHQMETAKAKKIYVDAGVEPTSVLSFLPENASQVTERQIRDLAARNGTTPHEICSSLELNAVASVAQTHFSKQSPRAHKVLMEAK